jgi:hypothetical protein
MDFIFPEKIPPTKAKYCSVKGLSKPNSSLMRAMSSDVAPCPAMTLAGSPGIKWMIKKLIKETPIKIGMIKINRLIK